MSWGYDVGKIYNRRVDIHARYGGSQRNGIITIPNGGPIFLISGDEGYAHGYMDQRVDDDVFMYTGEGQRGDMQMTRGNRAIATHSETGRSLLLFTSVKGGLRFEGEMVCAGVGDSIWPDGAGSDRKVIFFELHRLKAVTETIDDLPTNVGDDLVTLRRKAYSSLGVDVNSSRSSRTVYSRAAAVRDYVLARAKGHCEGCSQPAPFNRADGSPYLEPHHIRRVSDGGPDHPAFVVALCPNCHRRVHAGADGPAYNATLLAGMGRIEPDSTV